MADALSQAAPSSLATQEARRLELDRARKAARPAPIDMDAGAINVPFMGNRILKMANEDRVNLREAQVPGAHVEDVTREQGRLAGIQHAFNLGTGRKQAYPEEGSPEGASAVDQAAANEAREQRLQTGLMQARSSRRQEGGSSESSGGASFGKMAGAAAASSGPAGAALGNVAGGGGGAGMGQKLGAGIIKGCWEGLAPSFGLTVIILDMMFLLGYSSKFFRKYIPEVGHEWIPEEVRKTIPKAALLPVKYAELTALVLVTGLVSLALAVLAFIIVFIVSLVMALTK